MEEIKLAIHAGRKMEGKVVHRILEMKPYRKRPLERPRRMTLKSILEK
jgi:hypothetical protein